MSSAILSAMLKVHCKKEDCIGIYCFINEYGNIDVICIDKDITTVNDYQRNTLTLTTKNKKHEF